MRVRIGVFRMFLASAASAGLLLASCSMGGVGSAGDAKSLAGPANGPAAFGSILGRLKSIMPVASTVPANGDINPYGVAVVKRSVGKLVGGDILVSNFNNSANLQGTGTTIVQVAPGGAVSLFAQLSAASVPGGCPGGIGLTTALVELSSGWVIVGSLPTTDGTAATSQAGCLIVLDSRGNPVETIQGTPINGPWDMTAWEADDEAALFVTNVLNGTVAANGNVATGGTVVRVDLRVADGAMPRVQSMTVIGSGFPERTDPAAMVIGPTGVGLGFGGDGMNGMGDDGLALFVADSLDNRVTVIPNALGRHGSAGTGSVLSSGGSLNDPLGLVVAPNGNVLTVNGNDGLATEITPRGVQIASRQLDSSGSPPGAGALFGLAFVPGMGVFFVDDATNTLNILH